MFWRNKKKKKETKDDFNILKFIDFMRENPFVFESENGLRQLFFFKINYIVLSELGKNKITLPEVKIDVLNKNKVCFIVGDDTINKIEIERTDFENERKQRRYDISFISIGDNKITEKYFPKCLI